jgi:hypothetical protein
VPISDHALDVQIFQDNSIIANDQGMGDLVEQVLALIGDVLVLSLQGRDSLPAVASAQLSSGDPPLQHPQFLLFAAIAARVFDHLPVAGGQEMLDAYIDPHGFPGGWKGLLFHFTGKTGIPLPRLPADPDRLDLAFQQPVPAQPDPPDPREPRPSAIHLEAVPVFLQPKAIEAVPSLESVMPWRFPGLDPPEEGAEGLVQILHHHLQQVAVEPARIFVLPAILLHLPQLLVFPHASVFLLPGLLALGQAGVVPPPAGLERFFEPEVLGGGDTGDTLRF